MACESAMKEKKVIVYKELKWMWELKILKCIHCSHCMCFSCFILWSLKVFSWSSNPGEHELLWSSLQSNTFFFCLLYFFLSLVHFIEFAFALLTLHLIKLYMLQSQSFWQRQSICTLGHYCFYLCKACEYVAWIPISANFIKCICMFGFFTLPVFLNGWMDASNTDNV